MTEPSEPVVSSHEYGELLDIQPSSFRVDVALHSDIFLDLHLTNLTQQLVTFKVKTTARDRYQLKPTQGYIPAAATKQCKIVLSALSAYPDASNAKNVRDKFLVQSVAIGGEVDDLSRFWKEREARHAAKDGRYAYAEQIVKCKLNVPTAAGGGGDSPSRADRDEREREREERREQAAGAGGGGIGGGVVVDEVKEQQQSGQKLQPALPATSNSSNSFTTTQQRLSYPPAISITSTPTQPPESFATGAAQQPATVSSASFTSALHPSGGYQHDTAVVHPSVSISAANTTNGSSTSGSSSRSREYNELMEFTVRLTAQMEREKADAAIIADKYNKALAHIAQLQKRLAVITAQQQRDRNNAAAGEAGERGEEEKGGKVTPLSAAKPGGDGKEEKASVADKSSGSGGSAGASASGGIGSGGGGGGAVGMRERLMSGDGVRNNTGGFTWQIYQIVLVAIIAFVLGRLLSK